MEIKYAAAKQSQVRVLYYIQLRPDVMNVFVGLEAGGGAKTVGQPRADARNLTFRRERERERGAAQVVVIDGEGEERGGASSSGWCVGGALALLA